jgi:hypothetical protein
MRVREAAAMKRRSPPILLAPASPGETTVVVHCSAMSSSGGMPIAEP